MLFILVRHWLNQKCTWDGKLLSGKCVRLFWQCFLLHARRQGANDGLWWPSEHGVPMAGYDDPQNTGYWCWVMMTLRTRGANDGLWWPQEHGVLMTGYDDPQNMGCRWRVMMTLRTRGTDAGLWWPSEYDVPMMGYDDAKNTGCRWWVRMTSVKWQHISVSHRGVLEKVFPRELRIFSISFNLGNKNEFQKQDLF